MGRIPSGTLWTVVAILDGLALRDGGVDAVQGQAELDGRSREVLEAVVTYSAESRTETIWRGE